MKPLTPIEQRFRDAGYVPRYTVICRGGKRYRLQFANVRLRRAIEFGRPDLRRIRALKSCGWRVECAGS